MCLQQFPRPTTVVGRDHGLSPLLQLETQELTRDWLILDNENFIERTVTKEICETNFGIENRGKVSDQQTVLQTGVSSTSRTFIAKTRGDTGLLRNAAAEANSP